MFSPYYLKGKTYSLLLYLSPGSSAAVKRECSICLWIKDKKLAAGRHEGDREERVNRFMETPEELVEAQTQALPQF
jgi:hypothetical protein